MSAPTQALDPSNQCENIYLTAKVRMNAEVRLRNTGKGLNYLITWYSFCLICLSLIDITDIFELKYFGVISVICSIGLLVMSLLLQGERHLERADRYRDCYLKLQTLYRSDAAPAQKISVYDAILLDYDNHEDCDYDVTLFDAWRRNKVLRNAQGVIDVTKSTIALVLFRIVLKMVIVAALVVLPAALTISAHLLPEAA